MRFRDRVSAQPGRFTIFMIGLVVTVSLLLIFPVLTQAQSDPLSPSYMPTIDTNPADYPSNIWITDTMQKVRQDSGSPGPQHWGTFYGTQNEFVDFQVHVNASSGAISNLSVTVSSFVKSTGPGGNYTISNTMSVPTTPPNIIVYREAYVHEQQYPTNCQQDSAVTGGGNYNTYYQQACSGISSYFPDILIPSIDPYWGQTTNAWPFTVASGNNQSTWVDILIPRAAPAGYYLGSVTVKSGSTTLATIPVILAVWQWPSAGYMPSTPTLKSVASVGGWSQDGLCDQMYTPGATTDTYPCVSYPGASSTSVVGNALVSGDASLLMKDHRYPDGSVINNNYPQAGSFASFVLSDGPLLNGTCNLHNYFSGTSSGTTCPLLAGSKNTTEHLEANGFVYTQPIWTNWQTNFTSNGWGTTGHLPLYLYLCDEPNPPGGGTAWSTCISNATTYRAFSNPGIPLLVTSDIVAMNTAGGQNSVDILVQPDVLLEPLGGPLESLSLFTTWLAGSTDGITRQWWGYGACTEGNMTCSNGVPGPGTYHTQITYPNRNVDGKPAANRAMSWMEFFHGQTGDLYYAADVSTVPGSYIQSQSTPSGVPYDPWSGIYYSGGWGDGTLVYAGSVGSGNAGAVNYMGSSVTIPLVLPSVRLKHIRDGVQDYEYLNVLKNNGQSSLVSTQIASWITNSYTFETSGAGLQAARTTLGTAIHQLSYPASISPPPSVNGTLQLTK